MRLLNDLKNYIKIKSDLLEELLWANIWHDTAKGITWLDDSFGISPGREAVGYNYLYVMTRILNELKPLRILDVGLGASSILITQYIDSCGKENSEHVILEHSKEWADFYTLNHHLSNYSKIHIQRLVKKSNAGFEYWAYENAGKDIVGHKFSVISIDAPYGYMEGQKVCGGGG